MDGVLLLLLQDPLWLLGLSNLMVAPFSDPFSLISGGKWSPFWCGELPSCSLATSTTSSWSLFSPSLS
uniref:Putative secreted protein n=1 Tax=Panstrongylus lignarius TaxID=156445 RepID=A0A224Y6L9_9HEMI